jgi:hypothetical protein
LEEVVNGNFVLAEKTVENIKLRELVLGGEAQTARDRQTDRATSTAEVLQVW